METAPNSGFPIFTPTNGDNSGTFNEGPDAFFAIPNPFIFTRTEEWSVSIF